MGVSSATAEFLIEARSRGVDFTRTVTVGRQALFIGPRTGRKLLRRHGFDPRPFDTKLADAPALLDPLLHALGAREVLAMDASDYEGAEIVHDLNQPLPEELRGRFTTVFDGGTLEHVFDVPAALRSYMELIEVGGHVIIHTMANNYLGHGFYQFSPELFFRVFSPENGFEVERIVLTENDLLWSSLLGSVAPVEIRGPWYEAVDPQVIHGRALLQTDRPVVIQVQARKVADRPLFERPPMQSDYVMHWGEGGQGAEEQGATSATAPRELSLRERLGERLPIELLLQLKWDLLPGLLRRTRPWRPAQEARLRSFANPSWFRRVK